MHFSVASCQRYLGQSGKGRIENTRGQHQRFGSSNMKRHADLEEARVLLQEAKRKLARAAELLRKDKCAHADLVKILPSGPRDNGEAAFVCANCGRLL